VREGKLRSDLFYRLTCSRSYCRHCASVSTTCRSSRRCSSNTTRSKNKKDVTGVDEECMKALQAHPWPGNVRQLRNVIERALIVCEGRTIRKPDLPDDFRAAGSGGDGGFIKIPLGTSLDDVEKEMITRTSSSLPATRPARRNSRGQRQDFVQQARALRRRTRVNRNELNANR